MKNTTIHANALEKELMKSINESVIVEDKNAFTDKDIKSIKVSLNKMGYQFVSVKDGKGDDIIITLTKGE